MCLAEFQAITGDERQEDEPEIVKGKFNKFPCN